MYLFPDLCIYLFLLVRLQHANYGGGPCVAPEHHWSRRAQVEVSDLTKR